MAVEVFLFAVEARRQWQDPLLPPWPRPSHGTGPGVPDSGVGPRHWGPARATHSPEAPTFGIPVPWLNGAVLRTAGEVHGGIQFQVVLLKSDKEYTEAFACVYTSDTGMWGSLISTKMPSGAFPTLLHPSVMVGSALYWLLSGDSTSILEFDLDAQSLAVIKVPVNCSEPCRYHFQVISAEGGGLAVLFISGFNAQLWKRKIDCDDVASWVLDKTIMLDNLFSLGPENEGLPPCIIGFAEDHNVVFIRTEIGLFMVELESMKFKQLTNYRSYHDYCHSFTSVFAGI